MTMKNGRPCKKCGTSEWDRWSHCMECHRRRARGYYVKDKEKIDQRNRDYYAKNRERFRERNKTWRKNNRVRSRERERKWRERNPEKHKECIRRWRRNNRERCRAANDRHRRSHLEADRNKSHRRRVKKAGNGGSYTEQEWMDICKQYDHRCLRCGRQEPDIKLTIDHVLPIDLGGTNSADNMQPLCKSCNSWKGAKHIDFRNKPIAERWVQKGLFGD